jgi:trimeric autotransporter adhesin
MSTKTTFKRIALVAVAALGFGTLSVVPSSASTTALSLSLSSTSITVVGGSAGSADALVAVTVTSDSTNVGLAGSEQVKFSVVGVPTGVITTKTLANSAADLTFLETEGQAEDTRTDFSVFTTDTANTAGGSNDTDGIIRSNNSSVQNNSGSNTEAAGNALKSKTYTIAIKCASGKECMDTGVYTIAADLMSDASSILSRTLIKIDFVTDPASSGAVLTATSTGSWFIDSIPTVANMNANRNITGTIRNRDGGAIRSNTGTELLPTAVAKDASTTAIFQTLTVTGTAANEYGYSATRADNTAFTNDGNFTIFNATAWTADLGPNVITVRYGLSSATASVAMLTQGAAASATSVSVIATGQKLIEPTANNWTLPLTAKTANYVVTGATAGASYVVTVTYANVAAGDQTPLGATPTTVSADASGVISVAITNGNPIDGATATVNLTGFTTNPTNQVITWTRSKAAAVTVSLSGAYVALKSANTFTATVTDTFGAPVAGVLLRPVVSGANADLATAPRATLTTNASGTASITVTDAAGVVASTTLGTTTVTFTEVGTTVSGASTITYAATAPAATALTALYSTTPGATLAQITTPVPATGIYYTPGVGFELSNTRNTSRPVSAAAGTELAIEIVAGVAGAAVTAVASKGAYILAGTTNLETSTRTRFTDADGLTSFVVGTHTAGANTITFTSGTATTTVAFWGKDATAARFVTLNGPKTLAANGTAGSYVAAVTDRFGNPVEGVTLSISATGVATLGGGATLTSFTTDSTGTFTFQGTSTVAAGGAGSFKVSAPSSTHFASIAGYVETTAVNADLAAGSNSATVAVAFSEGTNAAEANAQAALDAAAEATDAANAATDAANAAAEAADAATAAAQDAADAVAALSTSVSAMISDLKRQITALTNLVIKIQRKVRA